MKMIPGIFTQTVQYVYELINTEIKSHLTIKPCELKDKTGDNAKFTLAEFKYFYLEQLMCEACMSPVKGRLTRDFLPQVFFSWTLSIQMRPFTNFTNIFRLSLVLIAGNNDTGDN